MATTVDPRRALVVGVDYGTLSGRAVIIRVHDGAELGSAVLAYPHAVMDRTLTAGPAADAGTPVALRPDWALQVPGDYVDVLKSAVPAALAASLTIKVAFCWLVRCHRQGAS